MKSPRSFTLLVTLIASLLLLAACANAAPTVAQFRGELKALKAKASAITDYKQFGRAVDAMLKYPNSRLPAIFNSTFIVPTNKALFALGIKTLQNATAMEAIGRYNVLARQYTGAQLLKLPAKSVIKTRTTAVLMRYASVGANAGKVVLGPPNAAAALQGVVLTPDLYTGKFLKAHGTSVFFRPKGY